MDEKNRGVRACVRGPRTHSCARGEVEGGGGIPGIRLAIRFSILHWYVTCVSLSSVETQRAGRVVSEVRLNWKFYS